MDEEKRYLIREIEHAFEAAASQLGLSGLGYVSTITVSSLRDTMTRNLSGKTQPPIGHLIEVKLSPGHPWRPARVITEGILIQSAHSSASFRLSDIGPWRYIRPVKWQEDAAGKPAKFYILTDTGGSHFADERRDIGEFSANCGRCIHVMSHEEWKAEQEIVS